MTHTAPTAGQLVLEARYPTPKELLQILTDQRDRQRDLVVPAGQLSARGGRLVIAGEDGGEFTPLRAFDEGVSEKLKIHRRWLSWMSANRTDLYDATVTGLLQGGVSDDGTIYPPDKRRFLVRTFTPDTPGGTGLARAFLSDRYNTAIDHLDIFAAVMNAINAKADAQIRDALGLPEDHELTKGDRQMYYDLNPDGGGIAAGYEVRALNLTEDDMHIRILFPGIAVSAPDLTENYRNPFGPRGLRRAAGWVKPTRKPKQGDTCWVGIDFKHNAVGEGSYWLTPLVGLCICDNGVVIPKEAIRTVHIGGQLPEGEIIWSAETKAKAFALALSKTNDALSTFLTEGWLEGKVAELAGRGKTEITNPVKTMEVVAKACQFTETQAEGILNAFIAGAQPTAFGFANAVTAYSQTVASPGEAMELDYVAITAMETAADFADHLTAEAARAELAAAAR